MQNRREFVRNLAALGASAYLLPSLDAYASNDDKTVIAGQQYPWHTFYQRDGLEWNDDLPKSLKHYASSGLKGFEPIVTSVEYLRNLKQLFKKNDLQVTSLYLNSVLHDEAKLAESMSQFLNIAYYASSLGVKIIVTNPSPIKWGGDEDKSDDQLKRQAKALDALGEKLQKYGMTLAYHNHDAELRNNGKEFHYMLQNTSASNVKFCLDAHWVYRGTGNSEATLFEVVEMYYDRIVELHLRQSQNEVWTEAFGEGDIDYARLADFLLKKNKNPLLVLEQAVEKGTPKTLDAVAAHRKGLEYTTRIFKDFI
ncbi:MAG: TIM barrel protein [Cyclobacteriaceae bacterium]